MSIFNYIDYKSYIRLTVRQNQKKHGYRSRLAEAAGCQKSFFSKVMSGSTHLTAEHAAGLVAFWKLPEIDAEYFIELVQLERAGTPELRARIEKRIEKLRQDQNDLAKRFQEATNVSEEHAQVYYSSWQYLAIHYLLSIPQFRTVETISKRLHCPEDLVLQILMFLREMGLIQSDNNTWLMNGRSYHLPRSSHLTQMNHTHWRTRAIQNSFKKNHRDIHYTSVGSLSLSDVEKLRQLTLDYVDKSRSAIDSSGTEELFCTTVDFFQV